MWCVAELNEEYICKMEDVLETYEKPYDPAEPVVCLDEKPVTLHADVRPTAPAKPGREARRDNEYERRGTANVFCAVEPKAGRHFTFATPDRSAFEFARVACELALQYRDAETVHLVLDNLNIHCLKSLTDTFGTEMGNEVFRTQPARLVRGSSRRIMTMRFRPANIRVINRRVCTWAVIGPAVPRTKGERNLRFLSPLESPFFPQRSSEPTSGNTRRPASKEKAGVPPVGRNAGRNQNTVKPGGA